jgi:hypothetical protein
MERSLLHRMAGQEVYAALSSRASAAWCCAALALTLNGCQRKAPGPDECVAFAKVWVQQDKVSLRRSLVGADPFDDLVRECLTTPFDRALVECTLGGTAPQRCRAEYRRRVEQNREARSR